jgi:hypothetical protein
MYENAISNLVAPKKDIAKEVYKECTFKPQANNNKNDKMAKIKYKKDLKERSQQITQTINHKKRVTKSPEKNRLVVLYLDG